MQQQVMAQYGMTMNDYGYDPNMNNNQMFQDKANFMDNQQQQAGQNFMDATQNFIDTNYAFGGVPKYAPGGTGGGSTDQDYQNYLQWKQQNTPAPGYQSGYNTNQCK
jgi:hypothetical protein